MQFGETLRLLMEESNVTSRQLAKELRIPITMVNNFTHCKLEPDLELLKRIAAYFDVSTEMGKRTFIS